MLKTKLIFVATLVVMSLILAACSQTTAANPQDDRAEVVRLTLEWALVNRHIPDQGILPDPSNVVLSLENIDASLVPELEGIALIPLTSEEVQNRADEEGDFLHIKFNSIEVDSRTASVSIVNVWATASNSRTGYLSGGGCSLSFEKKNGVWEMKENIGPCWIA